ncbi:MAG: hypothetical protein RIR68_1412, partial [Pseudomonadota bacterium]
MQFSRFIRQIGLLAISTCALHVSAQSWPTKPIKLITSAAPGGVVD